MSSEFEDLLHSNNDSTASSLDVIRSNTNRIHKLLYYTGLSICGLAFIFGIVAASEIDYYDELEFTFSIAVQWWIGGFITGIFFIALGEIIKILHDIRLKLNK
ncbi:hypothetical protein [Paenibacillus luteus]|uniref:hypothetical protein n=1 Tax=Paenibacillus luteus TaxID=2545753 RepID=UPI00114259B6|nr:hypothetical protein [Paenibacillus luteus]